MQRLINAGFRPFDEYDWEAFAGCESDNPLIFDLDQRFTLILDYNTICVYSETSDDSPDTYCGTFSTRELAEDVALVATASLETLTPGRFELLFGEPV